MCVQPEERPSFGGLDTLVQRTRVLGSGGGVVSINDPVRSDPCIYFLEFKSNIALLDFLISSKKKDTSTTSTNTPKGYVKKCSSIRINTEEPLNLSSTPTEKEIRGNPEGLTIPKRRRIRTSNEQVLRDNLEALNESGFYWGQMSSQEALKVLENSPIGSFLIRDSADARFLYTLSVQTPRGPTSIRIKFSEAGFSLDGNTVLPSFDSVPELVEYLIEKGVGKIWLENSGRFFSPVYLSKPKRKEVSPLQHIARVALNKNNNSHNSAEKPKINSVNSIRNNAIPQTVIPYLRKYPYRI